MTIGTTFNVGTADASFSDYANHDEAQQERWVDAYRFAAGEARQAAFYQAAQAVIIAGIQAAAADHAADRQWDIANRQMTIAEEEYARYQLHFFCNEHNMADEACALEIPIANYDRRANRALHDIRRQFNNQRRMMARNRSRYCLVDFTRQLGMLSASEARATAAARDAAYRHEETHVRALSDVRFSRQQIVFGLGRGIFAGQDSSYSGAMGLASDSVATRLSGLNNLFGAISGGFSGMIQANYANRIANSPFMNSYSGATPFNSMVNGYTFGVGGPNPNGSGAMSTTPYRGY